MTIPTSFPRGVDEGGRKVMAFDILGPDKSTSILPEGLKMVLHVNPSSMQLNYARQIDRAQTRGGWVEWHWGLNPTTINLQGVSGGFVRPYAGLSNITGPTPSNEALGPLKAKDAGGTRRETIAYDAFLDYLALFRQNGAIYDVRGNVALQGQVVLIYDGAYYYGWFDEFSAEESAEKPYLFSLTAKLSVEREKHFLKVGAR